MALSCAVVLAMALVYTSFSAASEARQPSQLANAEAGKTYQLTGRVAEGQLEARGHGPHVPRRGPGRSGGGATVAVRYVGQVPDPFREGREIVIDVKKAGAGFEGQPDSLVTKCPSKFSAEPKT